MRVQTNQNPVEGNQTGECKQLIKWNCSPKQTKVGGEFLTRGIGSGCGVRLLKRDGGTEQVDSESAPPLHGNSSWHPPKTQSGSGTFIDSEKCGGSSRPVKPFGIVTVSGSQETSGHSF